MQPRRVGQLYSTKQTWAQDRAEYVYSRHGHELRLYRNHALKSEQEAISLSRVELALVVDQDVILLLCRFVPGMPWTLAPYSWWDVPQDEQPQVLPAVTPDKRTILQVHLVDASTGTLAAVRSVTLSPAFTSALESALRTHFETPPDVAGYLSRLGNIQQLYPDAEVLVPFAVADYRTGD